MVRISRRHEPCSRLGREFAPGPLGNNVVFRHHGAVQWLESLAPEGYVKVRVSAARLSAARHRSARRVRLRGYGAFTAYNGDGLRISHTVGGTTTAYTWDVSGGLPVILQDGASSYVYGLGLISSTDGGGD